MCVRLVFFCAGFLLFSCKTVERKAGAPSASVRASAAEAPQAANDGRNAVRYVREAAEYTALCRQAYTTAQLGLDEAFDDPTWTAALEQRGEFGGLPPAVVLDVDETVLNNSEYQERLVASNDEYTPEGWSAWTAEGLAGAVPGALAYVQEAQARGIAIVYLTNRKAAEEDATRRNLTELGFPIDESYDAVLTRGEQPEWDTSDKSTRRGAVAKQFRILQLVGDNLGDFLGQVDVSTEERAALVSKYADLWGVRWIVLPNPMYGSWLVE